MDNNPIQEKNQDLQKRNEKLKVWLKNPYNLLLIGVILFACLIRFHYFFLTEAQPLWWDEAAYGALAKNFAFHMWDDVEVIKGETAIRPPLLPLIWSALIKMGFSEPANRFILELLPSILSILFIYLIGEELYNKKVGLISAFIYSVLWIHLFYTSRLLTHAPSIAFLFASIYFFSKSFKEKLNYKYFSISLILASLVALLRFPDGLIFVVYVIFLIFTKRLNLAKDPKAWLSAVIGLSPLLLFFLINFIKFGNIFPALLSGGYVKAVSENFAFGLLNYINVYLTMFIFIAFLVGIGIACLEVGVGYDLLSKNKKLQSHLLLLILFLVFYSFFIFYIKGAEDRWLFPLSLSFVVFGALGLSYFYDLLRKYNKILALIIILAILGFGAYNQLKFANTLINDKKDSYLQMRQGFEWLKDNASPDSIVLGNGIETYIIYYSGLNYVNFPSDEASVNSIEADYMVAHIFSNQPDYINSYLEKNQEKWKPVQVFFLDSQQTQAAFIIYQRQQ